MRSRSILRRLLAFVGAVGVATGGLGLGTAAAAHAEVPVLSAEHLCGALELRWSTGVVIGDEERLATVVLRNDVVVDQFEMAGSGSLRYGAADGDVFVIQREGLADGYFAYDPPGGCAGASQLYVDAEPACTSLVLNLTNLGTEPVEGLVLLTRDTAPVGEALAPVGPGTTQVQVALADGDEYGVITGPLRIDSPIWLSGHYARPAGCDAPTPTPTPPSPPPPPAPTTADTDGAGGSLPVTGGATVAYVVGGVVLICAGLGVVLAVRRRVRFSLGE